jgi:hypothetical protein
MRVFASAALAAMVLAAGSAQAAVSQVTFAGSGMANVFGNPSTINATQQVLLDAFYNVGGAKPFSITFEYDDAAPKAGGQFGATLKSATANGATTLFDGFTAFILTEQASFNPTWDVMHFVLRKTGHGAPTATTEAYFTLVDVQGGLFAGTSALPPGVIDTSIIDSVGTEIRLQNGGFSLFDGGGQTRVSAKLAPAAPPPGPGVPEPSTWALLIAGFLGVGTVLRRRRRAFA